ncbi:MAG: AMP-binding protein [Gammaproteobacteria bacterium]
MAVSGTGPGLPPGPDTLAGYCRALLEAHGDRPAFTCLDATLSFSELDRLSRDFAAWLQHEAGLGAGDRVALMMPNLLQYPVALFGLLRAGMTVVNVNPLYTPRELEHQLVDSGARAILVLDSCAATLEAVVGRTPVEHVLVTGVGDLLPGLRGHLADFVLRRVRKAVPPYRLPGHHRFRDLMAQRGRADFRPAAVSADDLAFLQYTGGTTGPSKGAMLTHGTVARNLRQAQDLQAPLLSRADQTVVLPLPLYHAAALIPGCLLMAGNGIHVVLIPNPRDLDAFVKDLRKYPLSGFMGINTLFQALLAREDFRHLDFSGLCWAATGGAPLHEAVALAWHELTGVRIQVLYGLTETSPLLSGESPAESAPYTGTVGRPVVGTEVSIRDESGAEVPPGAPGELCVRGPQVMPGYLNRPEETRAAFTGDGFFRTGDVVRQEPDGNLRIVDRKKDMILVSGFNVYPNEVENVVCGHASVAEAACVATPDERTGEAVKLFVVLKPGERASAEDIVAHCRGNLTAYKVPKHIVFKNELPKTNVGKILRRALREEG